MTHTDADLAAYVEELTEQGVRLVGGSVVDMGGVARAAVLNTRLNDTTAGDASESTPSDGSVTACTTKK